MKQLSRRANSLAHLDSKSQSPFLVSSSLATAPPPAVRRLRLRCRLNEGRVHVGYLTSAVPDKFPASTSDTEQIPGFGSLARDLVSLPQPPIGVHMLRANSALGAEDTCSKRPRGGRRHAPGKTSRYHSSKFGAN